jgi:hypothetical protein
MRIASISVVNTTTGASTSNPYPVNWKAASFGIGMGLTMTGSKGIGADVEHSFDDPKVGYTTWFKHASLTGKTASADGNYAYPITGIRLVVSAQSAADGTTTLQIVQSD